MPRMNGFDLAKEIRKIDVPIENDELINEIVSIYTKYYQVKRLGERLLKLLLYQTSKLRI